MPGQIFGRLCNAESPEPRTSVLCQGNQGRGGTWIWIGVQDAARLHEEYKARGVTIRLPPTNYPLALEMHIEDPDGNVLRIGSDSKSDQPLH